MTSIVYFGQTVYGEYPYNGQQITYNGDCINTCTTSPLANTGFTVWFAVTLACLLIFGALVTRFWKRAKVTSK